MYQIECTQAAFLDEGTIEKEPREKMLNKSNTRELWIYQKRSMSYLTY